MKREAAEDEIDEAEEGEADEGGDDADEAMSTTPAVVSGSCCSC